MGWYELFKLSFIKRETTNKHKYFLFSACYLVVVVLLLVITLINILIFGQPLFSKPTLALFL